MANKPRCHAGREWRGVWLALASCLFFPAAWGDEAAEPLWELAIGGFAMYSPAYPGSGATDSNLVALPFPIYRGSFLRLGEEIEKPVRGRLLQDDRFSLSIDMDFSFGADSDEAPLRAGMPDLDPVAELGPELEWHLAEGPAGEGGWYGALQIRGAAAFDDLTPEWRGWVISPEIRYVRYFGKSGERLKLRLTPAFASRRYMDYYYNVDPQFATNDRPAFAAKSGYLGTTLGASWHRPVTRDLELRVGARLNYWGGAKNRASPLFEEHSGVSIYVAFLYSFWQSEQQVGEKN